MNELAVWHFSDMQIPCARVDSFFSGFDISISCKILDNLDGHIFLESIVKTLLENC